jgi:hypothetical protein
MISHAITTWTRITSANGRMNAETTMTIGTARAVTMKFAVSAFLGGLSAFVRVHAVEAAVRA